MTALTPEQRELVEQAGDEPVRLENPEAREVYVVIRQEVFDRLREAGEIGHSDPSLFEFEDFLPRKDDVVDDSFPLAEEVRTYESHLPEWVDREGQFVLIKESEVLGFFPTYEQAMEAAYSRLGDVDFLVKQIAQSERIYILGNVLL